MNNEQKLLYCASRRRERDEERQHRANGEMNLLHILKEVLIKEVGALVVNKNRFLKLTNDRAPSLFRIVHRLTNLSCCLGFRDPHHLFKFIYEFSKAGLNFVHRRGHSLFYLWYCLQFETLEKQFRGNWTSTPNHILNWAINCPSKFSNYSDRQIIPGALCAKRIHSYLQKSTVIYSYLQLLTMIYCHLHFRH